MLTSKLLATNQTPEVITRFAWPSTDTFQAAGTFSVTYPVTPRVGDYVIVFSRQTNASGGANLNPSGWTLLLDTNVLEVYYKKVTDNTTTFSFTSAVNCRLYFFLVRGVFVEGTGSQATTTSLAAYVTAPTYTYPVLAIGAGTRNNGNATAPSIDPSYTNFGTQGISFYPLVSAWRNFNPGTSVNATLNNIGTSDLLGIAIIIFR